MSQSLANSKYTNNEEYDINLDELDPMLQGGYIVVYDKEIPVEIRNQTAGNTGNEVGNLQNMRIRILIISTESGYSDIKIQITSQTDIFFQFISDIDLQVFKRLKKQQSLNISFEQLVQMIIKLVNLAFKEPNNHFAVLFISKPDMAHLDFIENMEYKFIEVLSLDFHGSGEQLNKQSVSYRFNLLKRKMNIVSIRLSEISAMIKVKNPSLLQQITKSSMQQTGSKKSNNSTMRILK